MYNIGITLVVIIAAAAILVSVLRPSKYSQAVVAIGVVGMVQASFTLAMTAFVWAVLGFVWPNKDRILKMIELGDEIVKKKKKAKN
ncbi:MAG: hypothetical protein FWD33_03595 [Alphaproteobacteria bacterium]|nr:hypothetical protein [Alphaproteobacteria bacterium]